MFFLLENCRANKRPFPREKQSFFFTRGERLLFIFRYLIFYKKSFFAEEKNAFTPINKNFFFLKKSIFLFFEKKCFFWKFFFEKIIKKIHKFFMGERLFEILKKNFQKTTFFFKKKKNAFFPKNKVLVYRGKKFFFLQKKTCFYEKIKCPLNFLFAKMRFLVFPYRYNSFTDFLYPTIT